MSLSESNHFNIEDRPVTFNNVFKVLSEIWSSNPTSKCYIIASDWIDRKIQQMRRIASHQLAAIKPEEKSGSKEMAVMKIILGMISFKTQPKWMVMMAELFKLNMLTVDQLEQSVFNNDKGADTKFRKMLIYFRILMDSLELSNNPCQKAEWSMMDFIRRTAWIQDHAESIHQLFDIDGLTNYNVLPNLERIVFLVNAILHRCTGTKIEINTKSGDRPSIIKSENDYWLQLNSNNLVIGNGILLD